ncbi:MAG: GntR family transcriptional regulator [Pseudomonadota bacterium]
MSAAHREQVFTLMRDRILRGEFVGGTKLRASHLAEELGFSRTPVSEALMGLEAEGLLIGDKSGYTLRSFSFDEVLIAIRLCGLLEATAAQSAAKRGLAPGEIEILRDLLSAIDDVLNQDDSSDYDPLNEEFHHTLTSFCGSPLLIEEVQRSYRFPFAGPSAFPAEVRPSAAFEQSLVVAQAQHRTIVDAIKARESARAFALVQEHARLAYTNAIVAMDAKERHPNLALVQG